jgi:hypothetical protein
MCPNRGQKVRLLLKYNLKLNYSYSSNARNFVQGISPCSEHQTCALRKQCSNSKLSKHTQNQPELSPAFPAF